MKNIFILVIIIVSIVNVNGQCTSNYSYSNANDTLTFTNLSTVSNAHYYWNFGDGSGSNDLSPVHIFPDNGQYLVTLYVLDTVSNCTDVVQNWISVVETDSLACQFTFFDTIQYYSSENEYSLNIYNQSSNCGGFFFNCNVDGPDQNLCDGYLDAGWSPALLLAGMEATTNDSVNGFRIYKEYFKTVPFQFSPDLNYQKCSANFEVNIDYQPYGAIVSLTAMNPSGEDTFWIVGFGNPIAKAGHSTAYLYPYVSYDRSFPWLIQHVKTDTANGCVVSETQEILVNNPFYTFPASCALFTQPQSQSATAGDNVQFSVAVIDSVGFQWQQDAGTGFVNLMDAGPYSGVNTGILTIHNVQPDMNNFHYQCLISGGPGGCRNTSAWAGLYVSLTGINEPGPLDITIYPNPVSNELFIDKYLPYRVEIINALGQMVIEKSEVNVINVSELSKGVYTLLVYNENEQMLGAKMFLKE